MGQVFRSSSLHPTRLNLLSSCCAFCTKLNRFITGRSPIKTENSIRLFYFNRNNPGTTWKRLIEKVKTKYVYIGRNVAHFTKYDRLERLVREINNLDAYAVGSAIRGYHEGNVSLSA